MKTIPLRTAASCAAIALFAALGPLTGCTSPQCGTCCEQAPSQTRTERIRAKLPPNASLITLCVEGRPHSSEELAALVHKFEHSAAKHLVFVIGGSFGLHPSVKERAQLRLSMSPMTFPHHLARVMVLEQVYRAFQIDLGTRYHK